jgi:hypothetical protein
MLDGIQEVLERTQPTTRLRIVVGRKTGAGPLILERVATVADIVDRLASSDYEWTAVTALGWGMGPAQRGIEQAVAAATAAGFVTEAHRGGKRVVQLARRIDRVIRLNDVRIFVYDDPTAHHRAAIDAYRLPTADETDPDQTDPRDPADLVLVDALGGDDPADVPAMLRDVIGYLQDARLAPAGPDLDTMRQIRTHRLTSYEPSAA